MEERTVLRAVGDSPPGPSKTSKSTKDKCRFLYSELLAIIRDKISCRSLGSRRT